MSDTVVRDPRTVGSDEDLIEALRQRRPDRLFRVGKTLLEKNRPKEALTALHLAHEASPTEVLYMSYLGLAAALARSREHDAVGLCERAARQEFYKAELLNNLGRVYLLSGQRKKAYEAFRQGIELDSSFFPNHECLAGMGVRSKPVFGFLPRRHPLNRVAGRALRKLGLRL